VETYNAVIGKNIQGQFGINHLAIDLMISIDEDEIEIFVRFYCRG
jgi:hypothetical protein